jgi:UDP:flavonoid glycosyltransferase YjiC (YdhE family)
MNRRLAMPALTATTLTMAATPIARARNDFPNRPLRFVVPLPAGGPTDFLARTIALDMARTLGQTVVVENRPGADGLIAAREVIAAAAALAGLGPDVHVLTYVDQPDLLPHCDPVVSHGAAGTVLGACSFGRPQLVLPQAADQFRNARALAAAGAGRALDPSEGTEGRIAASVLDLLDDAAASRCAAVLAREIAAMPTADEVAAMADEIG